MSTTTKAAGGGAITVTKACVSPIGKLEKRPKIKKFLTFQPATRPKKICTVLLLMTRETRVAAANVKKMLLERLLPLRVAEQPQEATPLHPIHVLWLDNLELELVSIKVFKPIKFHV